MDTIFLRLVCCLLLSFTVETHSLLVDDLDTNMTTSTLYYSTVKVTNLPEETSQHTSTTADSATHQPTNPAKLSTMSGHTSQSATIMTSPSSSASVVTTTPSTQSSIFTSETTKSVQTTVSYLSTSDVNENASYTVSTATDSVDGATHGSDLNTSEKSMTIIFSAVLGVFALVMVTIMLHKCKHKVQYLHQPIHSSEEADEFVAGEDTLVISGGLYDGHPIYDRLPPDPPNQSQVCLEFLR